MREAALARQDVAAVSDRTLVHRLRSWEPLGPAAPPDREEEFVLTGTLSGDHPLLNDGPGRFLDLQAASEMVRETGEFIGQNHFGVPVNRTGIFYRFTIDTGGIDPWRTGSGPAQLTTTMSVRPDKVIDGVPRALQFHTALELDDIACGTGSANVLFLPPMLHRNHRAQSRASALALAGKHDNAPAQAPVTPEEVGRTDPGNVLLHAPSPLSQGRLSAGVSVPADWPVAAGSGIGHVPALVLLEALRQTSLLTADRAYGLAPSRTTLSLLQVHFRGYAEADLPMRCAAVAGLPGLDGQARRQAPITLTLSQAGRAVLEAVTTVVEDA